MGSVFGDRSGFFATVGIAMLILAAPATAAGLALLDPDPKNHVIADPGTGVALFGYDPVAYHVEHAARLGSAHHELQLDGKFWRFRSEANKAAFESDPAAFIPAFGGHDGAIVSNGNMAIGDPEIFVIAGGELVLFRDQANRDQFARESDMRKKAREAWPTAVRQNAAH